jgi:hypothetical protein
MAWECYPKRSAEFSCRAHGARVKGMRAVLLIVVPLLPLPLPRGNSRDPPRGKGVHFSDPGLRAHASRWVEKVGPWLERQAAEKDR